MGKVKHIYKHSSAFKFTNELKNDGCFTHSISKVVKLKKNQNSPPSQWFVKLVGEKRIEALAEVLTQEIMRLILPQQPKTRRFINEEQKTYYFILSKEIPEFNDKFFLEPNNNQFILNGSITGLAATQILALWLNEIDFKAGNVGVNQQGQVIKIDGGLSFITLNSGFKYLHDKDYRITSDDLEALPNLIHYQASNWLHHIRWNKKNYAEKKEPTELDKQINQNIAFKNEVYQTILRIISLPDALIHFFTQNYIKNHSDVNKFSNFMIQRKQQLEEAASKISGFKKYRRSNLGQNELFKFLNNLRNFKTMKKVYLLEAFRCRYGINAEALTIENEINYKLNALSSELDNSLECLSLEINTNNPVGNIASCSSKEIIFYINYLKNGTNNYLISSSNSEKNAFYNDLVIVLKTLETYGEDFAIYGPIVFHLIESIKKIVEYKDYLLNASKKPIPTPRNTKKLPSLFPSTFFNQRQSIPSEINQPMPIQSMLSN